MSTHKPLTGLLLSDVVPASTDIFQQNHRPLVEAGASLHLTNIDGFDFEHCLRADPQVCNSVRIYDIIYSHGFHVNTFCDDHNHAANARVELQLRHLRRGGLHPTCVLREAVHGQAFQSLFVGLHEMSYLGMGTAMSSFPAMSARVYRPSCLVSDELAMKAPGDTTFHKQPLCSIVSGAQTSAAMRYMVRTSSQEDQLDIIGMFRNTLRAQRHILQLGAGECRFAHALLKVIQDPTYSHTTSSAEPIVHPSFNGSWRKSVCTYEPDENGEMVKKNSSIMSYPDYVINTTGEPGACIGRVNLRLVAEWARSGWMQYHAKPAPMCEQKSLHATPTHLHTTQSMGSLGMELTWL